jgi:hypothetical protein
MNSNSEEAATEVAPKEAPAAEKRAAAKKETFQWSTPADEFADDVESDDEDDDPSYMDEVNPFSSCF